MNLPKLKRQLWGCTKDCTIRVNLILGSLAPMADYAQTQLPMLKAYLPDNVYGIALVVIVIANILLRFKPNCPLEEK